MLKIKMGVPIEIMSRIIYNIRDMKGGGIVDNGYTNEYGSVFFLLKMELFL